MPYAKSVNEHADEVLRSGIVKLVLVQVMSLHTTDTSHRMWYHKSKRLQHRITDPWAVWYALNRTRSGTVQPTQHRITVSLVVNFEVPEPKCLNQRPRPAHAGGRYPISEEGEARNEESRNGETWNKPDLQVDAHMFTRTQPSFSKVFVPRRSIAGLFRLQVD